MPDKLFDLSRIPVGECETNSTLSPDRYLFFTHIIYMDSIH